MCIKIDPNFDPTDAANGLRLAEALQRVQMDCLPDAQIQALPATERNLVGSQRNLSRQLDAALCHKRRSDHTLPGNLARHIALTSIPGAGAWLTARADTEDTTMDHPLFRTSVLRRFRVPLFSGDSACPMCGSPMDYFGDHAIVCQCGGDRTVRHNGIRDQVYQEAKAGGQRVEREKQGLLPARPSEDGLLANSQARRPADVWIHPRSSEKAWALNFACISGLCVPNLVNDDAEVSAIFCDYETYKKTYKDTEKQCEAQGIEFKPMVVEAHAGGMPPHLRKVIERIAEETAPLHFQEKEVVSLRIAQRISVSLQRETARAVLRRQRTDFDDVPTSGWDAVPEEDRGAHPM